MADRIVRVRMQLGLTPIIAVSLDEAVVGRFWKFQDRSLDSVSTIEAIAYAAEEAGLPPAQRDDLLVLFELQRMHVEGSGRSKPRMLNVTGSWAL